MGYAGKLEVELFFKVFLWAHNGGERKKRFGWGGGGLDWRTGHSATVRNLAVTHFGK